MKYFKKDSHKNSFMFIIYTMHCPRHYKSFSPLAYLNASENWLILNTIRCEIAVFTPWTPKNSHQF